MHCDDDQISRDDMLLFIARLAALADTVFAIVLLGRRIEDHLLSSCRRAEHVMFVFLGGLLGQVDAHRPMPGLDSFGPCGALVDRQAELLRVAASFRQIATALALVLSLCPRALRCREDGLPPAFRRPMAGKGAANIRRLDHARRPAASPLVPP